MKTTFLFCAAIALLALNACTSDNRQDAENDDTETNTQHDTPVKLIEYLIGEWQMNGSTKGGGDSKAKGGPGERITFTTEARYIAYEGNQKVDSGAYRMNEQLQNLYLESAVNKSPREFELKLQSDTLTLKPKNDSGQNGAAYIYRRVGPASVPPDKSGKGDETEQTEKQ